MKGLLNFLFKSLLVLSLVVACLLSSLFERDLFAVPPLKIGLTLSLTGRYAEMAEMQKKGFELWASEVNKKGGLLGREVKLLIYDDRSDPETAKRLYEAMIDKEGVDLIFAPYSSEITEAVAPVTERHGYPMIVSGASADRIWQRGYKYIFGLYTPASRYALGFLELLVINNIDDLAILYADDAFSVGVAEGTRKWAERLDLKVRYFKSFRKGEKGLEPFLKEAKASGAKVLILCGHLEESIQAKRSLKAIEWMPIYFATVGPATDRFYKILGLDAELTFSSSQWEHTASFRHCTDFYESFLKTYGIKPNYHAAIAYAAGQLIEQAVQKAKTTDRERVRRILSHMEAVTIIGRYKVDRSGFQTRHQNLITQWQGMKREIVWPESVRTAKPLLK